MTTATDRDVNRLTALAGAVKVVPAHTRIVGCADALTPAGLLNAAFPYG
jgi:hypothetical protein